MQELALWKKRMLDQYTELFIYFCFISIEWIFGLFFCFWWINEPNEQSIQQ